ncbi:MAG TPA: M14 metallopeptidase family protein, partial [Gemmatimonadaceae bacterium]|nr:M14 metallopeptidase family protein [Gemmatimonadaceae bacterium]
MPGTIHRRATSMLTSTLALIAAITSAAAQATRIPTPESVFGFKVGADSQLFGYDQSIGYFRRLAAASNRIKLIEVGRTSYGKAWTAVIISSPENLARLDHFRQINMRLAHPEGLSDSAARRLAREGRVIVDISGGLHASEIAGSQHTPQLAWELLSRATDPEIKPIFDNVIFFLWPSINPDGQDIVVNQCRAQYEGKNPGPMELYQKYIGHDNNRDSYMMNVIESRVVQRTWREWEPDIIYVHHQSAPEPTRIWVPPFADPVGWRAPPIPAREINTIGTFIAQELDARGQPGAVHMLATFDAWYPGYIDYMPVYQNIPAWWTETQGGSCATPKPVGSPENFPPQYRDLRPQPLYLSPWPGGKWGLRDAVEYMVTASTATLKFAARFKDDVLYNRYQSGRDVIRKYRTSPPYAYLVPQAQYDPVAPVELLRRFAFHGIRISQLDRDATYDGISYPRGTWVIPMDQEFAELVREVFEVQKYPALGDDTPYDAAGWTLPYQMNVNVVEGKTPLPSEFRAAMKPVLGKPTDRAAADAPFTTNAAAAGILPLPGGIAGTGDHVVLDPAQNNSFRLINRALSEGGVLRFAPAAAAMPAAPGSASGARYVVSGVAAPRLDAWASELAVRATRAASAPASVPAPTRVALYKSAPGVMDEGWTEWLFDTHGFAYTLITPADLQAGNLGARFDVIVFGSQGFTAAGGGRGGRGGGPPGGGGRGGRGAGAP